MKSLYLVLLRLVASGVGLIAGGVLVLVLVVVLVVSPTLPSIDSLKDVRLQVPLRVYSAEGGLIGEFGEERRIPVKIEAVPPLLIKAVLSVEDESFYSHQGVDFLGIARAAIANIRTGEHGQGASTITMQVARNYFLSPEKTYTRKIKEILLAFKIERELSKNQILELYLNKIFLGHRAYGFAAAAHIYYGRKLDELTLPEMAMLAGLPKAPSRNNPLSNPGNAMARRHHVLKRMLKLGHINEDTYTQAGAAPLTAAKHQLAVDLEAPYVAEMARHHMVQSYGQDAYVGGYKVYTTVSARHQRAADRALRRGLMAYDRRHGYRGPIARMRIDAEVGKDALDRRLKKVQPVGDLVPAVVLEVEERYVGGYTRNGEVVRIDWSGLKWARRYIDENRRGPAPSQAADIVRLGDIVYLQKLGEGGWRLAQVPRVAGALVALRPYNGMIVALSGGFNYYVSKFNRAIQAERQPGSNIKPFIYSAALEKGFTAASRISGAPIVIQDVSLEGIWRPENYSGRFFGPTRLRKALTLSLNLVSVRLLRAIGPGFAVEHLRHFGFAREKLPNNLSLALGTASLTPLEIATGYAVFANGGYLIEPYFIARVENSKGEIVEQANPTLVCPTCLQTADAAGSSRSAAVGTRPRYAQSAISPENAFIMTSMMRDVITSGTGRRALVLGRRDLAGKTGTTNDFRDAWFSGFNSDLVTTAWVGFDQPASLGRGEAGGRAALPIWIDYMRVALDGVAEKLLPPPPAVTTAFINRDTGQPTTADDPDGFEEYFMIGLEQEEDEDDEIDVVEEMESTPIQPVVQPASKKIPEGLF